MRLKPKAIALSVVPGAYAVFDPKALSRGQWYIERRYNGSASPNTISLGANTARGAWWNLLKTLRKDGSIP